MWEDGDGRGGRWLETLHVGEGQLLPSNDKRGWKENCYCPYAQGVRIVVSWESMCYIFNATAFVG